MSVTTDDSADVQHKRGTVRPDKAAAVAELQAHRQATQSFLTAQ